MFEKFIPSFFEKTVYEIDFKKYYDIGFRGILFDIDNTLVLHDEPVTNECKTLISNLKDIGFKIIAISNNKLDRVKSFCDTLDISYIYDAKKPRPDYFLKAIERLNLNKNQCVFIGDQLFTDISGANTVNMKSILVKALGNEKYFHIKVKRVLEKIILFIYNIGKNSE